MESDFVTLSNGLTIDCSGPLLKRYEILISIITVRPTIMWFNVLVVHILFHNVLQQSSKMSFMEMELFRL